MVEHVLASWVLYARWIADLEGSPDEVWLEHDLPDGTRVEDYETFFGCPVRFTQPVRRCWYHWTTWRCRCARPTRRCCAPWKNMPWR